MPITIEIIGIKAIRNRLRQFPQVYNHHIKQTLSWSVHKLWENVPPYPPKPQGSKYIRKGSAGLGGSLGSGISGGKQGEKQPTIFRIVKQGERFYNAEFGTNKEYAPFVIGERQAGHMGHWWTIKKIARKSKPDILKAFKAMAKELARFLDGKGLL